MTRDPFHHPDTQAAAARFTRPERRPLGRIEVAHQAGGAEGGRTLRTLTVIKNDQFETSAVAGGQKTVGGPQISSLQRPQTMPAKKMGMRSVLASATQAIDLPKLPVALRAHLATQVPIQLNETLYTPEELVHGQLPASESFEVLTFTAPDTHTTYLVTSPETRIDSSAKRRRWAIAMPPDERQGPQSVLCCLEFKLPKESGQPISDEQHLAQIQHELRNLNSYNRDIQVHALLKTQDGRHLALMTNLPEEGSYLLDQVSDALFDHAIVRFFADAVDRLHEDIHKQGLVHGDFKLSNVMITPEGRASIIDLASIQAVETNGYANILHTAFVPPEHMRPTEPGFVARFGQSGDVFSVGLALFDAYAEREAKAYLVDAESAPPANRDRLLQRAEEVRAQKNLMFSEMMDPRSGFHAWRRQVLAGGFDAQKMGSDGSDYALALQSMQKRAPELFLHWLTHLVSDRAEERSSLADTQVLLSQLLRRPDYLKQSKAIQTEFSDIARESLTSFVAPALEDQVQTLRAMASAP